MAQKIVWSAAITRKSVLPKVHRKAEAHARETIHCKA